MVPDLHGCAGGDESTRAHMLWMSWARAEPEGVQPDVTALEPTQFSPTTR